MIIGFCGLAGSGKDTSADFLVKNDMFVKVALADPLKRICREVYDFTDEQLWGPSAERNKPDKRYPTGRFSGLAWLCTECAKAAHGDPFEEKSIGRVLCDGPCTVCLDRFRAEDLHYVGAPEFLTPRYALQQLGTEWGRNCYPNTWVDLALRVAQRLLVNPKGSPIYYDARLGIRGRYMSDPDVDGVVISDVRFLNEVLAINAAGGYVFQLMRGQGLEGAAGQHRSETELTTVPKELFKGVIDNREWTLDQLESYLHGLIQIDLKG